MLKFKNEPKYQKTNKIANMIKNDYREKLASGEYTLGQTGKFGLGLKKAAPKRKSKKVVKKVIEGGGLCYNSRKQSIEKVLPTYILFGKFLIEEPSLIKDNILIVRFTSNGKLTNIKKVSVSDDFKDIIIDIQEKNVFFERNFNRLSVDEKGLMAYLLKKSGMDIPLKIPQRLFRDENQNAIIDRWNVVRKKIQDGDESPLLIKEAKKIVERLIQMNEMNKTTGYKLLYELCNNDI